MQIKLSAHPKSNRIHSQIPLISHPDSDYLVPLIARILLQNYTKGVSFSVLSLIHHIKKEHLTSFSPLI